MDTFHIAFISHIVYIPDTQLFLRGEATATANVFEHELTLNSEFIKSQNKWDGCLYWFDPIGIGGDGDCSDSDGDGRCDLDPENHYVSWDSDGLIRIRSRDHTLDTLDQEMLPRMIWDIRGIAGRLCQGEFHPPPSQPLALRLDDTIRSLTMEAKVADWFCSDVGVGDWNGIHFDAWARNVHTDTRLMIEMYWLGHGLPTDPLGSDFFRFIPVANLFDYIVKLPKHPEAVTEINSGPNEKTYKIDLLHFFKYAVEKRIMISPFSPDPRDHVLSNWELYHVAVDVETVDILPPDDIRAGVDVEMFRVTYAQKPTAKVTCAQKPTMMIAVSDVHLGHTEQKNDFKDFLDYIGKRSVDRLVIVGDFLDMWRRDMAGVVIENADVLTELEKLQNQGMEIDIVAGNHDYHIRILKREGYQFTFHESPLRPPITEYGKEYHFYHGYEFDPTQLASKAFFEPLCYTTDEEGKHFSDFYSHLQGLASFFRRILNRLTKGDMRRRFEVLRTAPDERLRGKFSEIRRRALEEKEAKGTDNVLIYGHTHEPFVDESQTFANTGSWVKSGTHPHYNTFLEIYQGSVVLKKWIEGQEKVIEPRFSADQLETMAELW